MHRLPDCQPAGVERSSTAHDAAHPARVAHTVMYRSGASRWHGRSQGHDVLRPSAPRLPVRVTAWRPRRNARALRIEETGSRRIACRPRDPIDSSPTSSRLGRLVSGWGQDPQLLGAAIGEVHPVVGDRAGALLTRLGGVGDRRARAAAVESRASCEMVEQPLAAARAATPAQLAIGC
jgi:hypothetical protein